MDYLPSPQQLKYFSAVAESLSFRKASEQCHVTQSTVSGAVQELESGLGVRLFERSKRKVTLTREGEALVAMARDALSRLALMKGIAETLKGPLSGSLRLGVIPTIAPYILPELVVKLRSKHPRLDLQAYEDLTGGLLEKLRSGTIECAIVALPHETKGLETRVMFDDRLLVALPPGHSAPTNSDGMTTAALKRENLLLLQDGHCLKDQALEACSLRDPQALSSFKAASLMTLARLVEKKVGVTFVPEMAVPFFKKCLSKVQFVPLKEPKAQRQICLCWRRKSHREADFNLLADFIKTQFAK